MGGDWGLWAIDDRLWRALFEELLLFMPSWDIPWCLDVDFNVIRFPSKRYTVGHLSWSMRKFSIFMDSCHLIIPPLEGVSFAWSSHEEVLVLSRIDQFLFFGLLGRSLLGGCK